jgi:hypothetical protein
VRHKVATAPANKPGIWRAPGAALADASRWRTESRGGAGAETRSILAGSGVPARLSESFGAALDDYDEPELSGACQKGTPSNDHSWWPNYISNSYRHTNCERVARLLLESEREGAAHKILRGPLSAWRRGDSGPHSWRARHRAPEWSRLVDESLLALALAAEQQQQTKNQFASGAPRGPPT